jgi:regulator of cell morphogenesis and NO signaling
MNNLLDVPLAEIVTHNYNTAKIFEKYGLDFCCKGKRTLKLACQENNIEADVVLNDINNLSGYYSRALNFDKMNLSHLADYIVNVHHSYVKDNINLILQYVYKVALKHGDRFPYMKRVFILFSQVRSELNEHLRKEEEVIFPLIKKLEQNKFVDKDASLLSAIKTMEDEHDVAGSLMHKIKKLTDDYHVPEQACTTFRLSLNYLKAFELDLHKHVYLENHILFPRALSLER